MSAHAGFIMYSGDEGVILDINDECRNCCSLLTTPFVLLWYVEAFVVMDVVGHNCFCTFLPDWFRFGGGMC